MQGFRNTTLINGGKRLAGCVNISGAKNATIPILAATLLSLEEIHITNIPHVEDVRLMFHALENLGANGQILSNECRIQIPKITSTLVPKQIAEKSRASIVLLGPLLARNGYAKVSLPGGCAIGDRKINYHLDGLRHMGASIYIEDDHIIVSAKKMKGIEYKFPGKTVTGTENLIMAATLSEGTTILKNCALEPEIGDLIAFLKKMGASIDGEDSETLVINGKTSLSGCRHEIIPDRIEMGTYLIAGCFGENDIRINTSKPEYIKSLIDILLKIGAKPKIQGNEISIDEKREFKPIEVETNPYPGFPTDLQAQLTTLLTQIEGMSVVTENIFSDRFRHTMELNKMGANISVQYDRATIIGKTELRGTDVRATDLRASAAIVLAGLVANGETIIRGSNQLLRGYVNIHEKFKKLGADIKFV